MAKFKKMLLFVLGAIFVSFLLAYITAAWNERPLDDDARAKAPGVFLNTSQGKIHYQWYGKKGAPVIVMAHGLATPSFTFRQNADALAAVGFRVLTFDHLGRGWSDRPKARYDALFYERELLDVLNGLALKEPVGLVGISMGGLTMSNFAGRYPDRVKALFLFVPVGFDLASDPDSIFRKMLMTPVVGDWIWRVFGKKFVLSNPQYDDSKLEPINQLQGDMAEQMSYQGYFQALLSTVRHLPLRNRNDVYQRLHATDIPVTALFGSDDTTVLPSSLDKLNKIIPRANGVMIQGGGHGLNYQMSIRSNEHLTTFFRSHLKTE